MLLICGAVERFLTWCEGQGVELPRITPGMVGAYFDELPGSIPSKKLHLAAIRSFFDILVQRHVVVLNPALSVKTERYSAMEGKTPEITVEQCRTLLASIELNHYVQAIHSFGNWLVTSRRMPSNPVIGLERLNPDVDVRHPRRALTPDEVAKLVESARASDEEIQCYSGEARARVYITSYMTGLRRKELASLTPRSFALDGDPPTVTVQATVSKHRKKDVLPLHPELVSMVKEWIVGLDADEPLFPGLDFRRTWLMVQKDLERAGIPYETAEGIADFHAAGQHSHVTELLRSGASLPEARELARHADVRTTMKYTHIGMEDRARALGNLRWQRIGSGARDSRGHSVASNDNGKASPNGDDPDRSNEKSKGYDTASHRVSSNGNDRAKSAVQIRFPPPPLDAACDRRRLFLSFDVRRGHLC